ncbi:MAG: alpha/beta fold hydrolase [Myxococcales bacterium]|nr:alpha/beta fold hydrolase [Myxococcales bacterium]
MKTVQHLVPNRDGWQLALTQTWDEAALRRDSRPVLIVPGYGMNSFIFGYHPRGTSLEGALAKGGLEVWRVDLRAQGQSRSVGGGDVYGLADLAITDLGAAIDAVLDRTNTAGTTAAIIGASLGGSLMFGHAAAVAHHKIGTMVSVGAPVRWVKIHPLLRAAFGSPRLVGLVRFRGSRQLAGALLPLVLKHTPWLLSVYMNPEHVDTSALTELVRTVEDPNRHVNREIAEWIRSSELVIRGTTVSQALASLRTPLLCVVAKADGIVPPETAAFPYHAIGSTDRTLLEVGSETLKLAHADMFISNHAHERVFAPVRDWLLER